MEFSPEKIYNNYQNNRYPLSKTLDLLLILIENSYQLNIRLKSLKILISIAPKSEKTYKVLEHCLISDEFHQIRAKAVEYLIRFFNNKAINVILWTVRNDASFLVLKTIRKLLNKTNDLTLYNEFNNRMERISSKLRIKSNELDILLDVSETIESVDIWDKNQESFLFIPPTTIMIVKDKSIRGLSFSLMKKVPQSITQLAQVEFLDLSYNYFKKLPYHLTNLESLKYLNLSSNEFKTFPLIFKNWNIKNHLELNLSNNRIRRIPNWIENLSYLKKLDLSHNLIETLPKNLFKLPHLEVLDVSNNRISNFDEKVHESETISKVII
jgi:Leucine-rich repeat (LRR) protein